jgi:hypothetical protein
LQGQFALPPHLFERGFQAAVFLDAAGCSLRAVRRIARRMRLFRCKLLVVRLSLLQQRHRDPDIARRIYLELDGKADAFGDPFLTGPGSYLAWLNEDVTELKPRVRRIWAEVYRSRPDLRLAFPDALNNEAVAFFNWIISSGQTECGLSEAFLPSTVALEESEFQKQTTPQQGLNDWRTDPTE